MNESEKEKQQDEPLWLVKSGERVHGPYTTATIVDHLRSKEIIPIDEVSWPCSRWRCIRDEPTFASAVEDLQKALTASREDTEVQGYTTSEPTNSGVDQAVAFEGADSETPVNWRPSAVETSLSPLAGEDSLLPDQEVRTFGLPARWSLTRFFAHRGVFLLILAIGFTVGLSLYYLTEDKVDLPSEWNDQLYSEAHLAWASGNFTNAFELYKRLHQLQPNRYEVSVRLAPLLARFENQTVLARRMLEDVVNSSHNKQLKNEAQMGLGLIALMVNEPSQAEVIYSSLVGESSFESLAHFSLGLAYFEGEKYELAADEFRQLVESGSAERDFPSAYLMLTRALLMQTGKDQAVILSSAKTPLENFPERFFDYRQEGYLLRAVVALEMGDFEGAQLQSEFALNTDPDLTSHHFHDPLLYLDPLSPKELLPFCEKIDKRLESTVSKALYGICLIRAGEMDTAKRILDASLEPVPQDPYLHSVNGYFLLQSDHIEAARAILRLVLADESPRLTEILLARSCYELQDWSCAREIWTRHLEANPPILSSLAGAAVMYEAEGNEAEASMLYDEIEALSPRYLLSGRLKIVVDKDSPE